MCTDISTGKVTNLFRVARKYFRQGQDVTEEPSGQKCQDNLGVRCKIVNIRSMYGITVHAHHKNIAYKNNLIIRIKVPGPNSNAMSPI